MTDRRNAALAWASRCFVLLLAAGLVRSLFHRDTPFWAVAGGLERAALTILERRP